MKSVQTAEFKAHLSEHLRAARAGETIVVLDRRTPVAQLVPIDSEDDLVVLPARGSLRDVVPPRRPPDVDPADIVADLLVERRERT